MNKNNGVMGIGGMVVFGGVAYYLLKRYENMKELSESAEQVYKGLMYGANGGCVTSYTDSEAIFKSGISVSVYKNIITITDSSGGIIRKYTISNKYDDIKQEKNTYYIDGGTLGWSDSRHINCDDTDYAVC